MSQKELLIKRKNVWHSFHVPGKGNYTTRPINGIFLSPANSWEHEQAKCRECYHLLESKMKFITEAVDNKTGERADIVVLDTGRRIEIETDERRSRRFDNRPDIDVVELFDKTSKKIKRKEDKK